jgi:hypothetical protein
VGDKFHVTEPRDEGGFVWRKEEMSYVILWWQAVEIICNVLSNATFVALTWMLFGKEILKPLP